MRDGPSLLRRLVVRRRALTIRTTLMSSVSTPTPHGHRPSPHAFSHTQPPCTRAHRRPQPHETPSTRHPAPKPMPGQPPSLAQTRTSPAHRRAAHSRAREAAHQSRTASTEKPHQRNPDAARTRRGTEVPLCQLRRVGGAPSARRGAPEAQESATHERHPGHEESGLDQVHERATHGVKLAEKHEKCIVVHSEKPFEMGRDGAPARGTPPQRS